MKKLIPILLLLCSCGGSAQTISGGATLTNATLGTSASPRIITTIPSCFVDAPCTFQLAAYAPSGAKSLSNLATMSSWSVTSGTLPTGLALDGSTGIIDGTPTSTGTSSVTFQGTSSTGGSASQALSFDIASDPTHPALPSTFLDTTYPDTTGYNVVTVVTSGGVSSCGGNGTAYSTPQIAVNCVSSDGGDTSGEIIKIASGSSWTENLQLPAYTMAPGKWVIITTNTAAGNLPAAGVRVDPSYAGTLAKIETNSSSYAVGAVSQANHYWLMGLEIDVASSVTTNYGIVVIGCTTGTCESSAASLPSYIYIDRCYIHGNNLSSNISRGISANGASVAVVNSYISAITNGVADSQAISAWNSPGPIKIVNNYLEAATENVMFGGADPAITNLVPSDIEIRRNWFFKPLTWYAESPTYGGVPQNVKNLLELKNSQRLLIEGNVFENSWAGGEHGFTFVVSPRNQSGTCTWCTDSNITLEYNLIENAGGILAIAGADAAPPNGDGAGPSLPSSYVTFKNNLSLNIDSSFGSGSYGMAFELTNGTNSASPPPPPNNVVIDHNTSFQSNSAALLTQNTTGNYITPFTFQNNVNPLSSGGLDASILNTYCGSSGYAVTNNLFENAAGDPGTYPSGNYFPTSWSAALVSQSQGDYHVLSTSPYHDAGTDGKDLGADIDAAVAATYGVD